VFTKYRPVRTEVFTAPKQKILCIRYRLRMSTLASDVGDGGGNQSHSDENPPDETCPVMFPLRLPAPFCEDVGDLAVLQIAQDAFHHAHPVGQHQGSQ
jgi:hypothetical protein